MRVASLTSGSVSLDQAARPRPGPGEALIRIHAVGISGSDLQIFRGYGGDLELRDLPGRPGGHEIAGTIAALGLGETGLSEGDRVVIEPMQLLGCGACPSCQRGLNNLCTARDRVPNRRASAGFAEFDTAVYDHLHKVPDGLDLATAALADLYAAALHAIHRAEVPAGARVLVVGTGPMAIALGQLLRTERACHVIMVGRRVEALIEAARLRASSESRRSFEPLGAPVDIAFEAVGGTEPEPLALAAGALEPRGTLCILGTWQGAAPVPGALAAQRELTILWSKGHARFEGEREIRLALDWLAANREIAQGLVTHRFSLDNVAPAFEAAADKAQSRAIKVLVEPQDG